jgi:DNA-binding PadR family transcriptional regulator
MKPTVRPESFLPLTPVVFDILVTLASGDQHGYGILMDLRQRTGEMVRPGSLYRALNRLLEDGLIDPVDPSDVVKAKQDRAADSGSDRRRPYRLTALGRQVAEAETARLDAQVRSARAARLVSRR